MAITKGATVIHVLDKRERRGTVLAEVAPHVVQGIHGESETTRRYQVEFPKVDDLPSHRGIYLEGELTVVPRDSRFA